MKNNSLHAPDWTLLVIDMQEKFCRMPKKKACVEMFHTYVHDTFPHGASEISLMKAWNLVMQFAPRGSRATEGLKIPMEKALNNLRLNGVKIVHFHHLRASPELIIVPQAGDILLGKTEDSVVEGSNIVDLLTTKKVALCGVNLDACVKKSALDLVEKEFEVQVIIDLCASGRGVRPRDNNKAIQEMEKAGIIFVTAATFIQETQKHTPIVKKPCPQKSITLP